MSLTILILFRYLYYTTCISLLNISDQYLYNRISTVLAVRIRYPVQRIPTLLLRATTEVGWNLARIFIILEIITYQAFVDRYNETSFRH
jgi:hypothetical protein